MPSTNPSQKFNVFLNALEVQTSNVTIEVAKSAVHRIYSISL